MKKLRNEESIGRGLYLAYWPNGSYSVVYFKTSATPAELFFELDAFGNPWDARVVHFSDDVGIDFEVGQRRGRNVIKKQMTDRSNAKRVLFKEGVQSFLYANLEAANGTEA